MADLTMCAIQECPQAPHCRRSPQSGTVAWGRQSWFANDPRKDPPSDLYCLHYWPTHA